MTEQTTKAKDEPKTYDIHVRVPKQTREKIRKIAAQENTTVSTMLRELIRCVTDENLTVNPSHINPLLENASQLRRIGVNLNQLVHAYNAGMLTQPVNANQTLSKIRELTESTANIIMDITDENAKHNARTKKKVLSMLENRQT